MTPTVISSFPKNRLLRDLNIVNEHQPTLLIVEDDVDIAEMLSSYFNVQGYHVLVAHWGEDGLSQCFTNSPDLIILDIRLPDIDGYEIARRVKANRRTAETPIIFLTERRAREDKIRGLELKAEDYITKPFDIQELRLRVRNALRRSSQGNLTNPVTGLPQGALVEERLAEVLGNDGWSLLAITLDRLERFRESYGFIATDDLLRAVGLMIHDALAETGSPEDFLGHLNETAYLLVIPSAELSSIRVLVQKRVEQALPYFYRDEDRNAANFKEIMLALRMVEVPCAQLKGANAAQVLKKLPNLFQGGV